MIPEWKRYSLGFMITTACQAFVQLPQDMKSVVVNLPVLAGLSKGHLLLLGTLIVVFGTQQMAEATPQPTAHAASRWTKTVVALASLLVATFAVGVTNLVAGLIVSATGSMGLAEGVAVVAILLLFSALGIRAVLSLYRAVDQVLELSPPSTLMPTTPTAPVSAPSAPTRPAGRVQVLSAGLAIAAVFTWHALQADKEPSS